MVVRILVKILSSMLRRNIIDVKHVKEGHSLRILSNVLRRDM